MRERVKTAYTAEPSTSAFPSTTDGSQDPQICQGFGYGTTFPHAPWATKRYNLSIEGLHEEVLDLYHWVKPSPLEANVRYRVFEKVAESIREKWKDNNVRISMFGSLRTNLFLPSSDIDVLVECEEWENSPLQETADWLEQVGLALSVSVFADAFVPIVKMVDRDTHLSIDISFNTVQGIRAAEFIDKVKDEFPVMEPLVLLLKQFLHHRALNQTFSGGLSSYGLILMLVNFFQLYALSLRKKNAYDDGVNLGELLIRFFEVYSQEFNYETVAICVSQTRYLRKEIGSKGVSTATLSLEDPLLSSNDVGRSSFKFSAVAAAFAHALQIIIVSVTMRDRRRSAAWHALYKGSILAMIMPFSEKEIFYRSWLKVSDKGFVFTYGEPVAFDNNIVTNTLLSPVVNLNAFAWLSKCNPPKVSRALVIMSPDEVDNEKVKKSVGVAEPAKIVDDVKKKEEQRRQAPMVPALLTSPMKSAANGKATTSPASNRGRGDRRNASARSSKKHSECNDVELFCSSSSKSSSSISSSKSSIASSKSFRSSPKKGSLAKGSAKNPSWTNDYSRGHEISSRPPSSPTSMSAGSERENESPPLPNDLSSEGRTTCVDEPPPTASERKLKKPFNEVVAAHVDNEKNFGGSVNGNTYSRASNNNARQNPLVQPSNANFIRSVHGAKAPRQRRRSHQNSANANGSSSGYDHAEGHEARSLNGTKMHRGGGNGSMRPGSNGDRSSLSAASSTSSLSQDQSLASSSLTKSTSNRPPNYAAATAAGIHGGSNNNGHPRNGYAPNTMKTGMSNEKHCAVDDVSMALLAASLSNGNTSMADQRLVAAAVDDVVGDRRQRR